MTHGSLFSGIGGFDLAAEWMGWENMFHCEWNEFGQKILKHYWPNAISYGDITKTDFTIWRGRIDILTGGFPCQPYSVAGKRKGKEDDRHLWPEMLRSIREIQPRYVVGENVPGLINWNDGLVFEEVQADLETEGYEVIPFILPAASVNAPHKRERVWFIAYAERYSNIRKKPRGNEKEGEIQERLRKENSTSGESCGTNINGFKGIIADRYEDSLTTHTYPEQRERKEGRLQSELANGYTGDATDPGLLGQEERQIQTMGIVEFCQKQPSPNSSSTELQRSEQHRSIREARQTKTNSGQPGRSIRSTWEDFPTQPPICGGNDGLPTELDGITFSKWRNESIKGFGNAIVPQVVFQIFKAIQEYDDIASKYLQLFSEI